MPVPPAAFKRVVEMLQQRRWGAAEAELLNLRRGAPRDPYVLFNLGITQLETGRPLEAAASWRATLDADPRFQLALINLGSLLLRLGDAAGALRYARAALGQDPRNPDLLRNLALAQAALGEHAAALATVEQGLALRPRDTPLLNLRIERLNDLERWAEARAAAGTALALPAGREHLPTLFNAMKAAGKLSDWPFIAAHLAAYHAAAARPGARFNPLGVAFSFDDPALLLQLARNLGQQGQPVPRPARRGGAADGRLTVGYLSPDLREHPVAHMLLAVLRHHDRARVRVVLIDLRAPDASGPQAEFAALADERVDLSPLPASEAPARLRRLGLDVLVDLAGVTTGGRPELLAARPCAVQLLWLGCAASTGMGHYDGFLLDAQVAPPGYEQHCSEPLVRLPCCFHPLSVGWFPGVEDPDATGRALAAGSPLTRADLGLPPAALVVAMLQQPDRIRPPYITEVVAVLARHPGAHLWLRVKTSAQDAVRAQLAALGLPPERVHFALIFPQRRDYVAALLQADLIVDSHPYGGHSTTGEALCLGLPVLATAGRALHARVAASMLHELGLGDLVAPDQPALLATLDRLLAEPELLAAWRARFAAAAAAPAAQRHRRLAAALEDAYAAAVAAAPA